MLHENASRQYATASTVNLILPSCVILIIYPRDIRCVAVDEDLKFQHSNVVGCSYFGTVLLVGNAAEWYYILV